MPESTFSLYWESRVLKILSSGFDLTFRSRNMNGSPGATSSFTQATPAPSCPRLCCFSIKRKSLALASGAPGQSATFSFFGISVGAPVGTVKGRMRLGLKKMRAQLGEGQVVT